MGERADTRGWGSGWPNCHPANIVTVTLSTGARLPVHRAIAELVKLACEEVIRRGFIIRAGASWGYACRAIRGSTAPSNHSWGLAVDLNAPDHPLGKRNTGMPTFVPAVFKRCGFRWGGDYSGRADEMHFEYMGTPQSAITDTARARADLAQPGHEPVPVPPPSQEEEMAFEQYEVKPGELRVLTWPPETDVSIYFSSEFGGAEGVRFGIPGLEGIVEVFDVPSPGRHQLHKPTAGQQNASVSVPEKKRDGTNDNAAVAVLIVAK